MEQGVVELVDCALATFRIIIGDKTEAARCRSCVGWVGTAHRLTNNHGVGNFAHLDEALLKLLVLRREREARDIDGAEAFRRTL